MGVEGQMAFRPFRLRPAILRCQRGKRRNHAVNTAQASSELDLLLSLAEQALVAAYGAATDHVALQNAKGDAVRAFDLAAHAAIERHLARSGLPLVLYSEEGVPRHLGRGAPQMRVIVDPVDGSDNFARGLPFAAMSNFCAAIAPPTGLLDIATVRTAVIHPLMGEEVVFLLHRGTAFMRRTDGVTPLAVNDVKALRDAMVSVELNHHAPGVPLAEVMGKARGVRTLGCCSAALLAVARGQLDAHIDIRGRLTPESWLAAAAMVRAAGGVVILLDNALERTQPPANLLQRCSLVAAATPELMEEILMHLRKTFL